MKKKLSLLLLITGLIYEANSQVVFYESFNAPFNPTTTGWEIQNLSTPIGTNTTGWFQGSATQFTALGGSASDYFAADMNSTSSAGTTNTISCWLITPTLNLVNGAVLQFATKGGTLATPKPDRLQVYYSIGTGTNVGTTAGTPTNSAGTFTNILLDINAGLTSYSTLWSGMTATLSGITTPTVGRIAFRYYVPNGGANGANGNYVGIDEVRYSLPCNMPNHFGDQVGLTTACPGTSVQLQITNNTPSTAITSYTWFTGSTNSITTVTPQSSGMKEIWSLTESTPGCQYMDVSFLFVAPSPTVTYTLNPGNVLCSGKTVTVTSSGAGSYTYALGNNNSSFHNPSVLMAPTVSHPAILQFTVIGKSTVFNCIGKDVITLTINPVPVVSVSISKSVTCVQTTVTLTANGASSYSWSGATSSTASTLAYNTGTVAGIKQFTLSGMSQEGCESAKVVTTLTVSLCAGIEDNDEEGVRVGAYPNPFNNYLVLTNLKENLGIYNHLGQLILEIKTDETQVDTSGLPSGLYFLKSMTGFEGEKVLKLIKN